MVSTAIYSNPWTSYALFTFVLSIVDYLCSMSIRIQRIVFFAFVLLSPAVFHAKPPIEKAFKALQEFNYFEAKVLFLKAEKKQPSAANYGLALIYFRTDNPFHNLDSAYACITRSDSAYASMSEKSKEKLSKYQFGYLELATLRADISRTFFANALKQPTEEGMDLFQQKHPWAQERFTAIHLRDSMALKKASDSATSAAFSTFLKKYPESEFAARAKGEFNRLQYREQTAAGTITSFLTFEKTFKDNPYVSDAQDQVYRLATAQNSTESFAQFIKNYPSNRNVDQAWRRLYQLYMYDYSAARLEKFQQDYPAYPFKDELLRDKELANSVIVPYKDDVRFGWMGLDGKPVIPAQYESVGFFKEGLAWAEKNGKYGYVNKLNEVVIDFQFTDAIDFEKGRAVIAKGDLSGIIDRSGTLIFPIEFKDIGQFSEDLIYAQKDSLYGYFDVYGYQRIQPQFTEAFSFSGGKARVKSGDLEAFIDPYGSFIVPPVYEEIDFFTDSLLVFLEGDYYGLMNLKGQVVVPATYDLITPLDHERSLFVKDDKVGYLSPKGIEIIPAVYSTFTNLQEEATFTGNYAKVLKGDKYGFIDKSGKVMVPFQYRILGKPGTMIAFEKSGKWGYIDLSNKVLLPPAYEAAETFKDGLGIVRMLTLYGAISAKGTPVIPLQFTEIKRLDPTHYLVSIGAKYGIYSDKGVLLVPLDYSQIRKIQDDFYLLTKGSDVHYFYLPENRLIKPQITE